MNSKICPFTKAPIIPENSKGDSLCYEWPSLKGKKHCVSGTALAVARKELPTPSEIKAIKKQLKEFCEKDGDVMICTCADNDNIRFEVRPKAS